MPATHTDTTALTTDGVAVSPSTVRRFGRVPARWLEDPDIGVDELAVLAALAVHANRDGVCIVRQRALARLLQRSREWVCRVLARLCEPGGFVEKEHRADCDGWNLACRYRLPDLALPEDGRAGSPGGPEPAPSGTDLDGTALDDSEDLAGGGGPAPTQPMTPAPKESVTSSPAAVTASAPADMTGGAHQEQTNLNKESASATDVRCSECHCRERAMGSPVVADSGVGQSRPVPANWQPDADDRAWLAQHRPDLNAGYMTAVFVCGSRARGMRYADPSAAWRRWALAERTSGRQPTASAEPPRGFRGPPRPAPSAHHAAQEARNAAEGQAVLAQMMARRGEPLDGRAES